MSNQNNSTDDLLYVALRQNRNCAERGNVARSIAERIKAVHALGLENAPKQVY